MTNDALPDRAAVVAMVIETVDEVVSQMNLPKSGTVTEETRLLGRDLPLDSLALVTLIVDLEQRIAERYGASLTLASERAMSRHASPFRSVGTLADFVCELLTAEQA